LFLWIVWITIRPLFLEGFLFFFAFMVLKISIRIKLKSTIAVNNFKQTLSLQKKIIMSIVVGQQAPEFTLYDSDKNKVNLADFKGKNVLLLFYPQAFTGVCTKELCAVRDDISRYSNVNAQVLGISVDSVFTLAKFKEEQQYNFPLLSDFNKDVSALYHTLYTDWILDMKGVSKRSAFIIDKDGIIRYTEVLESAGDMPDFKAINEILDGLNT
jgi:glutaredoxin-dependent peroxiredoxin